MPVQWRQPSRKPSGLSFLSFRSPVILTTLEAPKDYAVIALHWQEARGQSFPCMGDGECLLCPGNVKVHCYTVVLAWDHSARAWRAAIADLGHPDSELVQTDLRGQQAHIGRERPADKRSNLKLMEVKAFKPGSEPPQAESVDVRPHLMRRWGLFDEADRLTREPYYEQQRLTFPLPDAQAGAG